MSTDLNLAPSLGFIGYFGTATGFKSKNLTVSVLCDRETTNVSKAQMGFISFIVKPTFYVIIEIVPKAISYIENIDNNLKHFQEIIKKEEEIKSINS